MKLLTSALNRLPEFQQLLTALEGGRSPTALSGAASVHRCHIAAGVGLTTGRPVVVAEGERTAPLFPREHRPGPGDLTDPAAALTRLGTGAWRGRFRLLPYRSVGVDRGLLLAVRLDGLELDGQGRGPVLVALSPTPVSDGGGYQALVGAGL